MINPYKVIKELGFERIAGTQGEKKAIEILVSYLQKLNLKPKLENFQITSFETGTAKIEVGGKVFSLHPFGLNEDVSLEKELVFLENPEIIIYNKKAFKGKIVLSYGYSRKITEAIKNNEIAAYLAIGSPHREAPSWSHRQKSFSEGYVPSATVKYEVAEKLMKYSGKSAKLTIKQSVKKLKAENIIVDIKGKGSDENLTLAVAHYDTVARSFGATDNSGGTVTLLKIAEYFSSHRPERNLRIIFFSGEELGLLGSQAYVKKHLRELREKAGLVVNVDVSGDAIGIDAITVLGSKELLGYAEGISKEIGVAFKSKLDIYSSDGMPFAVYEIPSVNIARWGGKGSFFIHTPGDNPKYIGKPGLENTVKSAINLLNKVLNAKIYPIKKEIDDSLRDKIEKYLWNLTKEKPELYWTPKYKK